MFHRQTIWLITTIALLAVGLQTDPAYGKRPGRLSPAKVKQIKKSNKNFKQCQKKVLREGRKAGWGAKKVRENLAQCKERFPAASLSIDCKKRALKKGGRNPKAVKAALQNCRNLLLAATFDPAAPIPALTKGNQLFFAGIGLNQETLVADLQPPNFTCTRLRQALSGEGDVQYVLFGNEPSLFPAWNKLPEPRRNRLLRFPAGKTEKVVPRLGQLVLGDSRTSLYFGSAACDYEGEPGKLYEGVSTYYLQPAGSKTVVPFFGIAYYRMGQKRVNYAMVTKKLKEQLGPSYQVFSKNDTTTFIAAAPLTEFDDEGDPMNLCRPPMQHPLIGVVQAFPDKPGRPQYLLVANIRNLCRYGNRAVQNLAARKKP